MKLLTTLLVITLFFSVIFAVPHRLKRSFEEEECDEEELAPADYEPALGVPDLIIDLRENVAAPVEDEDEDCEDEIVTEEPEVLEMATEECEEEPITAEPETQAAPLATESECVDEFTTEEEPTTEALPEPEPTQAAAAAEVTSECADEEVIEELPVYLKWLCQRRMLLWRR